MRHGTRHGWVKHGCRCDECRQARLEEDRARRQRRIRRAARGEISIPHGKAHAYADYGCRCDLCTEAMTVERRRQSGAQPRRVFTDDEKARALTVYGVQGMKAAAASVRVSPGTVRRWVAAAGIPRFQRPIVHGNGTRSGYQRGCRCPDCVESNQASLRLSAQKRFERAKVDPSIVPHGTINGYRNYACRCSRCKAAGSVENRRNRLQRKRAS